MTVRPLQSAWRFSRNEHSGKPGAVHKLRLLKAALEQVMGHEVQTMTLSYTDSGSPRLRVGFSVTLLGASSPAATSTAPAVPAPSPGRPPSSVVLVDRRFGGEDELVEEPEGPTAGVGG